MEIRLMPIVTFRCDCGEQLSIRVNEYRRKLNREDITKPHPKHHGKFMNIIQIQHFEGE